MSLLIFEISFCTFSSVLNLSMFSSVPSSVNYILYVDWVCVGIVALGVMQLQSYGGKLIIDKLRHLVTFRLDRVVLDEGFSS